MADFVFYILTMLSRNHYLELFFFPCLFFILILFYKYLDDFLVLHFLLISTFFNHILIFKIRIIKETFLVN